MCLSLRPFYPSKKGHGGNDVKKKKYNNKNSFEFLTVRPLTRLRVETLKWGNAGPLVFPLKKILGNIQVMFSKAPLWRWLPHTVFIRSAGPDLET